MHSCTQRILHRCTQVNHPCRLVETNHQRNGMSSPLKNGTVCQTAKKQTSISLVEIFILFLGMTELIDQGGLKLFRLSSRNPKLSMCKTLKLFGCSLSDILRPTGSHWFTRTYKDQSSLGLPPGLIFSRERLGGLEYSRRRLSSLRRRSRQSPKGPQVW